MWTALYRNKARKIMQACTDCPFNSQITTSSIRHSYFSIRLSVSAVFSKRGPLLVVVYKLSSVVSFSRLNSAWICLSDFGFFISNKTFFLLNPAFAHAGTPTVWGVFFLQTWLVERLQTGTRDNFRKTSYAEVTTKHSLVPTFQLKKATNYC